MEGCNKQHDFSETSQCEQEGYICILYTSDKRPKIDPKPITAVAFLPLPAEKCSSLGTLLNTENCFETVVWKTRDKEGLLHCVVLI